MKRATTEHAPETKFLLCDYLPDSPSIFLYHTQIPRFFVKIERRKINNADVEYKFHIGEIIDIVDDKGKYYTDDIFQDIVKDMANSFEKYLDFYTANKINLSRFGVEN